MSFSIWPQGISVNNEISSRCCLVTGGGRGIGRSIVIALAEAGVRFIVVNYLKDSTAAAETCTAASSKATNSDFQCISIQADVSKSSEVDEMMKKISENSPSPITILVNNAGQVGIKNVMAVTETDFDNFMNINAKSAFLVSQAVVPGMIKEKFGRLITISSVAAYNGGSSLNLPYAMSKAALIGLINTYATLFHQHGITSNGISPGLIETDMIIKNAEAQPEVAVAHLRKISTMTRMGKPDECANIAVMIAKTGYLNGQIVTLDGGMIRSK